MVQPQLTQLIVTVRNCRGMQYKFTAFTDIQKGKLWLVSGSRSDEMELTDAVFQGRVRGPALWNIFYADAAKPIHKQLFAEINFAGDLNALWKCEPKAPRQQILKDVLPGRTARTGAS